MIANHKNHYFILYIYVSLLACCDVTMLYKEQLNNANELLSR